MSKLFWLPLLSSFKRQLWDFLKTSLTPSLPASYMNKYFPFEGKYLVLFT